MTLVLVKLLIRVAVFTVVFWAVAKKNKDIVITPRWALPLVAGIFAVLNAALYWILKPVANAATFGMLAYFLPLLINGALLWGTIFILRRKPKPDGKGKLIERPGILAIQGILALALLAFALTVAHGLLWFVLEYIPARA